MIGVAIRKRHFAGIRFGNGGNQSFQRAVRVIKDVRATARAGAGNASMAVAVAVALASAVAAAVAAAVAVGVAVAR